MKNILGIDPGLKHCGYAKVVDDKGMFSLLDSNVMGFGSLYDFAEWLKDMCINGFSTIGIEDWTYRGPGGKGDSSITVPKMIGIVLGIGVALSIPVIVLPTDTWKFALTSVKKPSDHQVQRWVETRLNYLFPIYKLQKERDKNFHAIEAAGIALVAGRRG